LGSGIYYRFGWSQDFAARLIRVRKHFWASIREKQEPWQGSALQGVASD